jgi:uncharacterized MAPEG superfamily protein
VDCQLERQQVASLTGPAGRVERTPRNYLETLPFDANATLLVVITGKHSWLTVCGAHVYFWGRIACVALYAANFPLARSLVWNIPAIGILMSVAALVQE